mmetsp:Transcript_57312/g.170922  ORF Transcript_57312/g.170922 Transcript_57312/m.170922 type:complete len:218 (+) Transcript_57312:710-1363(+)
MARIPAASSPFATKTTRRGRSPMAPTERAAPPATTKTPRSAKPPRRRPSTRPSRRGRAGRSPRVSRTGPSAPTTCSSGPRGSGCSRSGRPLLPKPKPTVAAGTTRKRTAGTRSSSPRRTGAVAAPRASVSPTWPRPSGPSGRRSTTRPSFRSRAALRKIGSGTNPSSRRGGRARTAVDTRWRRGSTERRTLTGGRRPRRPGRPRPRRPSPEGRARRR